MDSKKPPFLNMMDAPEAPPLGRRPFPPDVANTVSGDRAAVAKFSTRHSKLLCSCSHMILLSKKKEKQKQLPIEHYNFKNHLLLVAIHREQEIKVLAFKTPKLYSGL